MSSRLKTKKRSLVTGEERDQFATIAYVEDVKVAAIIAAYVHPLKERVAELERPWWKRLRDRLRRR